MAVQPHVDPRSMKLAKWLILKVTGLRKGQAPEWEVNPERMSEDCLYLNVTTPSLEGRRPVLFWIHGGAFVFGTGSGPLYRGTPMCTREDVVLVTVNYRLGCFGFMNVPGGETNCGSYDQLQALRWVHEEISRFGGDPERITIIGQSAGAMSCGVLLASPLAQPYFKRAILMSGAMSNVMSAEDQAAISRSVAEHAGAACDAEALRAVSAEKLLYAQSMVVGEMPFQPCIDGELIPDFPLETLARGLVSLQHKDVILGCTAREFNLFSPLPVSLRRTKLEGLVQKSAGYLGPNRLDVLDSEQGQAEIQGKLRDFLKRLRSTKGHRNWQEVEKEFSNFLVFVVPSRLAARRLSSSAGAAGSVYLYSIDFDGGRLGAAHAFELPLLFGLHSRNRILRELSGAQQEPKAAEELSRALMGCFCAFARDGRPTAPAPPAGAAAGAAAAEGPGRPLLPYWPQYRPDEQYVFVFDRECRIVQEPPSSVLSEAVAIMERARRPFGIKSAVRPAPGASSVAPAARL